jgi:hypothetical protein
MRQENITNFEGVERWFVIALTVWAACGFIAAWNGLISSVPRLVLGPLLLVETVIPILVYYRSRRFHAYISSIDLKHLTIFHLWRLLAGFTFVAYGSQHLLPHTFVRNAGYGDILVGLLVPVVLVLPRGTGKYLVFHIIGMLDFILAVGTGITLTLQQVPLMWNLTTYPVILIPLLGVPISGAMHVMALDIAWKRRRQKDESAGLRRAV